MVIPLNIYFKRISMIVKGRLEETDTNVSNVSFLYVEIKAYVNHNISLNLLSNSFSKPLLNV